jgi:hypothetical protein
MSVIKRIDEARKAFANGGLAAGVAYAVGALLKGIGG